MGTVTIPQVTAGSTARAADVDNMVNTLANEFNGNIDNANIKAGAAIDAAKLAGGISGMFGAPLVIAAPAWTNFTIGSAVVTLEYQQIGKLVVGFIKVVLGAGSVMGSAPSFTAPVAAASFYGTGGNNVIGSGYAEDVGTASENCCLAFNASTTQISLLTMNTAGTYGNLVPFGASVPNATGWTSPDFFNSPFMYFAA